MPKHPKDKYSDWRKQIYTDTVTTPSGCMTHDALTIVQILLDSNIGIPIESIIRFVRFHINRGGTKLANRTEIQKALQILLEIQSNTRS